MAVLSFRPGVLDIEVYRGDDQFFTVTMRDKITGGPLVLPTAGWKAEVRAKPAADSPVVFEIGIDASAAATGVLGFTILGADTADMAKRLAWDLQNQDGPIVRTYLAGFIIAEGQVTR